MVILNLRSTIFPLAICFCLCMTVFGQDGPQKIALLVGVSDYDAKEVDDLQFAENDIRVVGGQLKLMGFEVTSLSGEQATRKKTIATIDDFMAKAAKLESSDIVFVMFSGHGQQIRVSDGSKVTEVPYFCPVDSQHFDETKISTRGKTETQVAEELNFVSLNRVLRGLDENSNSLNNLLVVDACRNNPSKGKSAGISGTSATVPQGVNILFAAGSGQKSWESADKDIQHGVFTHFLIKGLQGDAKNRRDQVTWSRLASYLQDEVAFSGPSLAGAKNRVQNPHSIINSTNLIVLGQPTSDEQVENRLYDSLRNPSDVFDIAELCNDKEFVIAPVYQAMLLSNEEGCARGWEILRPHFDSPEFISFLLDSLMELQRVGFKRKKLRAWFMEQQLFSIGNQQMVLGSLRDPDQNLSSRLVRLASRISTTRNYFKAFDETDDVSVGELNERANHSLAEWDRIVLDSNAKLTQQTIELLEGALKNLKVERDRFLSEVDREDSDYHLVDVKEHMKLASAKNEIFDRVKKQLDIDAKYLETILPNNLKSFTGNEFLQKLRLFRARAAVKLNHPDAVEFVAETVEARGVFGCWALSDELLEFSKLYDLNIELREACANTSRQVAEKTSNPYEMRNFAKWSTSLPAEAARLDATIELLETAIKKLEKRVEAEDRERERNDSSGFRYKGLQEGFLSDLKESLRELKRKREGM